MSTLLIQYGHALQVCEVQTLRPEGVQGQPARGVPHLHLAGGYTSMGCWRRHCMLTTDISYRCALCTEAGLNILMN